MSRTGWGSHRRLGGVVAALALALGALAVSAAPPAVAGKRQRVTRAAMQVRSALGAAPLTSTLTGLLKGF